MQWHGSASLQGKQTPGKRTAARLASLWYARGLPPVRTSHLTVCLPLLPACRGAKWLLLSSHDTALSSLCQRSPSDGLHALGAAYFFGPAWRQQRHRPAAATEVVASNEGHLHSLLSAVQADHLLCVEPVAAAVAEMLAAPGTPPRRDGLAPVAPASPEQPAGCAPEGASCGMAAASEEQWQQAAHTASMCWVYRARQLARQRCRVSLVSRGRKAVPGWPSGSICAGSSSVEAPAAAAAAAAGQLGSLAQGVAKTLFMEERAACGACLDLPPAGPRMSARQLAWLLRDSSESCCALRSGQLFAERLVPQPSPAHQRQPALQCHPGMACVVTGGTRGLGLQFGRQLVARGCRALVLTSRSGLLSKEQLIELAQQGGLGWRGCSCPCMHHLAARRTCAFLASAGAAVLVARRDAADPAHGQALAAWLHNQLPAVQVYGHAAGLLGFDLVPDVTADRFGRIMKPKASGGSAQGALALQLLLPLSAAPTPAPPIWLAGRGRKRLCRLPAPMCRHCLLLLNRIRLEPGGRCSLLCFQLLPRCRGARLAGGGAAGHRRQLWAVWRHRHGRCFQVRSGLGWRAG